MEVVDIRRRTTKEDVSRRHCSVHYFLPVETGKLRICQKTLCNILQITTRRLQVLQQKIKFKKPLQDDRRRHCNRPNKIPDDTKTLIKNHVGSFPKQESHYSRRETNKDCLSPGLSINKMYKMFLKKYPTVKCTNSAYRDIFKSDFKLRFGLPRSDC